MGRYDKTRMSVIGLPVDDSAVDGIRASKRSVLIGSDLIERRRGPGCVWRIRGQRRGIPVFSPCE